MIIVNKERCLSAVKIDSTVTYSGQWTPHKDRVTHMQPSVSWSSASCSSQKLFLSVASDRKEFPARSCRWTADGSGWSGLFRSPHDPALLRSTHTHTRSRYNYCMDCDSCSALGPNAHLLHDRQINNTISGNWRAGRDYFTWYMCNRVKSIWELLYFIQIIMLRLCEFYLKDLFLFTWMFPVETTCCLLCPSCLLLTVPSCITEEKLCVYYLPWKLKPLVHVAAMLPILFLLFTTVSCMLFWRWINVTHDVWLE